MINKQFKQLYKLLKADKSNSGFTLIELLSGLIMSTIVVVGLSYGLVQLTRATRDETNKVTARNESTRAIEFISDELRRAQNVVDLTGFASPTGSVNAADIRLALNIPGLDDPVIYFVVPANDNWQGDLVINRWGPPLGNDGDYGTGAWGVEPLLDGLDDATQTADCNGTNVSYQGFFACRRPDGITAQLYFSSEIDIANTDDDKQYKADTQVVARARVRNTNNAQPAAGNPISFKTLGAEYSLHTRSNAESANPTKCNGKTTWTMRTDFINGDNITTWIHDEDRQGQQINVNPNNNLQIASIPIGNGSCSGTPDEPISRGNKNETKDSDIYTNPGGGNPWTFDSSAVQVSEFTIDFNDYLTFNGNTEDDPNDSNNHNDPNIPGVEHVKVYKQGSIISDINGLLGYDDNTGDTFDAEDSLGKFLWKKGYAIIDNGKYRIVKEGDTKVQSTDPDLVFLKHTERIIAVEIGQVQNDGTALKTLQNNEPNPGFDLQDNVMLFSMDKFEENYSNNTSP